MHPSRSTRRISRRRGMGEAMTIELEIIEPGEGDLSTIIDRGSLDETIMENLPYVAIGTQFVVDGRVVATKSEREG